MGSHKIRSTINPGEVLTVDDAELLDLDRQGLVYSSESGESGKHKWRPEAEAEDAEQGENVAKAAKAPDDKKGA